MSIGVIQKPTDWAIAKQEIYDACNWNCSAVVVDEESKEYAASSFTLSGFSVLYREAKITPTKIGLFVTLWKRLNKGPIEPYHQKDSIDFVIINTRDGDYLGQFIFPKSILVAKGILSTQAKEGKRGFRVYPPWSVATNKQAQTTQKWQSDFFIQIHSDDKTNLLQAKKLLIMPS